MKIKVGQSVKYCVTHLLDDNPAWPITFKMRGVVIDMHKGNALVKLEKGNGDHIERWLHKSSLEIEG